MIHADGISGGPYRDRDVEMNVGRPIYEGYDLGDRVRFMDLEGEIISTSSDYWHKYMTVKLDSGRELLFEKDGRYWTESEHRLVVIGKVKPKVKRWKWVGLFRGTVGYEIRITDYMSDAEADNFFQLSRKHSKIEWTEEEQDA